MGARVREEEEISRIEGKGGRSYSINSVPDAGGGGGQFSPALLALDSPALWIHSKDEEFFFDREWTSVEMADKDKKRNLAQSSVYKALSP